MTNESNEREAHRVPAGTPGSTGGQFGPAPEKAESEVSLIAGHTPVLTRTVTDRSYVAGTPGPAWEEGLEIVAPAKSVEEEIKDIIDEVVYTCDEDVEVELQGRPLTIRVRVDQDAESPRAFHSDSSTFLTWEGRSFSPDDNKFESPDDFLASLKRLKKPPVLGVDLLPVYKLDHSGVAFSTSRDSPGFSDPWDVGQVGFIWISQAQRKTCCKDKTDAEVAAFLTSQVETYGAWANGEVYGYQIEDEYGNDVDTCYGYYGYDDLRFGLTDSLEQLAD